MSNDKTQISPIPPEGYGERFIKFISGLTMSREEQAREGGSGEQFDGTVDTTRPQSVPHSRTSNEAKVVEKAEKQAQKTEKHGATEEPQRDRTLSSVRSPSADRSGGVTGATLPVVEEDGEAASRENSVRDEKRGDMLTNGIAHARVDDNRPPPAPEKDRLPPNKTQKPNSGRLPSIPNFNRLSLGLQSGATPASASER